MKTAFKADQIQSISQRLSKVNNDLIRRYPGESLNRQPVHTVYGGAHLFKSNTATKLGTYAQKIFHEHISDSNALAQLIGVTPSSQLVSKIYDRVCNKLAREPVEDYRIDFEDGFGFRKDEEEDFAAIAAAQETALGLANGELPPYLGIRVKSLSEELKHRAIRTLDLYLTSLVERTQGKLPSGFVITLPKVYAAQQVEAFVALLALAEQGLKLKPGSLRMEIMVEVPQILFDETGNSPLARVYKAGLGRIVSAHFGAYDYTAACGITGKEQTLDHPACDFARQIMKVCLANQEVFLSDGATNILPIGSHDEILKAWQLSFKHIQNGLRQGFYQGWDLHPAQIPIRYAAIYSFFLSGLDDATMRLKSFLEKAAQASRVGLMFDDAASGQGLLNFFIRAFSCGAISEEEISHAGLTLQELQTRSFLKIVELRR